MWIEDLKESLPDAVMILVGNKMDRTNFREVSSKQIEGFCQKFHIDAYHEVSALTGQGIVPRLVQIAAFKIFHRNKS